MRTEIGRDEVRRLLDEDAQLVEVLPAPDYADEHVAGAVNIPLKELDERAPHELDRDRPVIVYCNDYQ
jgi:rhodanese-related sulfurtransferase